MYEMTEAELEIKVESLALFVGTGQCNARCSHCAGIIHRKYAPKEDGIIDKDLMYRALRKCYEQGARHLSLTSSGEPILSPLSVTKTLELVHNCRREGLEYSRIHLYSNGIRIGEDREFCDTYLPLWKSYGLALIYVTVHDLSQEKNAQVYGVESYPRLEMVISRIHQAHLLMRANLMLSKETIYTADRFISTAQHLREIGADYISAWPLRSPEDKVDQKLSPPESELDKMEEWIKENFPKGEVRLLREDSRILYQSGRKLTLFPDGTLSNTWCKG